MSKKGGLRAAHLWAARTGCPRSVYGMSKVSKIDPVITEEQKRKQEQVQKKLEKLFSSANPEAT